MIQWVDQSEKKYPKMHFCKRSLPTFASIVNWFMLKETKLCRSINIQNNVRDKTASHEISVNLLSC